MKAGRQTNLKEVVDAFVHKLGSDFVGQLNVAAGAAGHFAENFGHLRPENLLRNLTKQQTTSEHSKR